MLSGSNISFWAVVNRFRFFPVTYTYIPYRAVGSNLILARSSPTICDHTHSLHATVISLTLMTHLIPLHAWHPMQPLTNMFTINFNSVSGDRECRKSATCTTQQHRHAITYKQLHKMTSWNKLGWANENIIAYQTIHSFRVCGQLYPWEKTSHT